MAIFAKEAYAAGVSVATLLALRFAIAAAALLGCRRRRAAPALPDRRAASSLGGLGARRGRLRRRGRAVLRRAHAHRRVADLAAALHLPRHRLRSRPSRCAASAPTAAALARARPGHRRRRARAHRRRRRRARPPRRRPRPRRGASPTRPTSWSPTASSTPHGPVRARRADRHRRRASTLRRRRRRAPARCTLHFDRERLGLDRRARRSSPPSLRDQRLPAPACAKVGPATALDRLDGRARRHRRPAPWPSSASASAPSSSPAARSCSPPSILLQRATGTVDGDAAPAHAPAPAPARALAQRRLPEGDGWAYEPKWDGFRAIAFVDGDDGRAAVAQRQAADPLLPRGRVPRRALRPRRRDRRRDVRSTRSASASTRPRRASRGWRRRRRRASSPSTCWRATTRCSLELPYDERRAALEALRRRPVELTPVVRTAADAEHWLHEAEGVIAKEVDAPVPARRAHRHGEDQARADDRRRRHRLAPGQGRGHGRRAHPRALRARRHGCARSATPAASRPRRSASSSTTLAPYETGERGSGEPSRWTPGRDLEWVALRPELVVEVTFDHVCDGRIRHGAKVQRWREDKAPEACTVDQLDQ